MQRLEETPAKVDDPGFLPPVAGEEREYLYFIETEFINTAPQRLMDKLIRNSVDRWGEPDVLVNSWVVKVCKHSKRTERVLENPNSCESEEHSVEYGNIVELKKELNVSPTASKGDQKT